MSRARVHSTAPARSDAVVLVVSALAWLCCHVGHSWPGEKAPSAGKPDSASHLQTEILLRAARNSVSLGDLPEALSRFEKLLQLEPHNSQARFEYAGLLLREGRWLAGRRELERLVAEKPDVGAYRLALADVLVRLQEYAAAREQVQPLLSDKQLGTRAAITMARTLVLDRRFAEARRFYDEHLRDLHDVDQTTQIAIARLLVDMRRPAEAERRLEPLYRHDPTDAAVSTTLALALVRMNARIEALGLLRKAASPPLDRSRHVDPGAWLELAAQLYREHAFAGALAAFQRVVERHPHDQQALLGKARTHLRLYQVDAAKELLDRYRGEGFDRDYTTVLIDYHTVVGEYAEAIALARDRLQADPTDIQAAILLADAYHASYQFAMADAAYRAALARCPATDHDQRREIRRLQTKNYLLSHRLEAAIATSRALLEQRPEDIGSRLLLVQALTKSGCYDAAAVVAHADDVVDDPRGLAALQTELGYVWLREGRNAEAAAQFRSLAASADDATPDVAYGLYRSLQKLGQPGAAREALALGPSQLAPPATWGVALAGRALSFCDCQVAAATLDQALAASPANLVLLTMRGEAAQQCDGDCQGPECACCWFCQVIEASPTNVRARLGCARSCGKHLNFDRSLAQYQAVRRLMPGDVNVLREEARMVEGWKGFQCAQGIYCEGAAAVAQQQAAMAQWAASSAAVVDASSANQPHDAWPEPFHCVTPCQLLGAEYQARSLRGWRAHQALESYERLIDLEPSNEAALFDLGQCHSTLNRTYCAVEAYERLLCANPCHEDAAIAWQRALLEMGPKVATSFDYQDQRGRDGLANITWYNVAGSVRRPLGDENEYLELGYRQRFLQPSDDRLDVGEIPFARWQRKYDVDTLLFAELAVEQYDYGLATRPTFNAGVDVLTASDVEIRLSGFLKNYFVCGEAIRQDIYTAGVQLDAIYCPARSWTLSGTYRWAGFSDDNSVNWLNVDSAHVICEGRTQLRGLLDFTFYSFAQQTIFGPDPDSLVGTIHPYWSPSGYSFTSAGLELKRCLSCDTFKGADEHYWTLFAGGGVDSNGVGYALGTCRWQKDLTSRVTWTLDANLTRSPNEIYNAVGAATYGVLRW